MAGKYTYLLLYGLMFSCFQSLYSQSSGWIVVDKQTLQPAAYLNVYNRTNGKGTVTNLEGYFELPLDTNHSIEIFAIGYKKLSLSGSRILATDTLYIEEQSTQLSEYTLTSEDPFLAGLIVAAASKKHPPSFSSRTYFELETFVNEKQVELVEEYFNGTFHHHKVDQLIYKEGRIALENFGNRYFVSTEISKAFYSLDIFNSDDHFPASPLHFSKQKIIKNYKLRLAGKYLDENGNTVFAIRFIPRLQPQELFEGTVWIDSATSSIHKINLKSQNASVYPFLPLVSNDSILNVKMDINVVFQEINKTMFFNNINFKYSFDYISVRSYPYSVKSNAILYAYKKNDLFIEPLYNYNTVTANDYRNINSAPYNDFFWSNLTEFRLNDEDDGNNRFFNSEWVINSKSFFNDLMAGERGFFQNPYLLWNKKRIKLKEITDSLKPNTSGLMPTDMYHIGIKIYADINPVADSLHILTATIYDPYDTFFYYPIDNASHCFINLYFDLVEISRRQMEKSFGECGNDAGKIKEMYNLKNTELKKQLDTFLLDTEHGTNMDGMKKWNDYVLKQVGIDNLAFFQLK